MAERVVREPDGGSVLTGINNRARSGSPEKLAQSLRPNVRQRKLRVPTSQTHARMGFRIRKEGSGPHCEVLAQGLLSHALPAISW